MRETKLLTRRVGKYKPLELKGYEAEGGLVALKQALAMGPEPVIEQIKRDGQVREWFNLTSILYDESERKRFLNRLFHIVNTPT